MEQCSSHAAEKWALRQRDEIVDENVVVLQRRPFCRQRRVARDRNVDGDGRGEWWSRRPGPCGRHLFGQVIEGMRRRRVGWLPKLGVGQVGDSLGRGREDGRAVLPPHGCDQRDGHQGVLSRPRGEHQAQLRGVVGIQADSIKAVAKVGLGDMDRPMRGVGEEHLPKEALEGVPELHRLGREQRDGFLVHIGPGVVAYPARASAPLGDNAGRRCTKSGKGHGNAGRENNPLPLADHIDELFLEEVDVVRAGLVGAPPNGVAELCERPRRRGQLYRGAPVLVQFQEALGRVVNVGQVCEVAPATTLAYERRPTFLFERPDVPSDELT